MAPSISHDQNKGKIQGEFKTRIKSHLMVNYDYENLFMPTTNPLIWQVYYLFKNRPILRLK